MGGQAVAIHGRTRHADNSVSSDRQEFSRSVSVVHVREGERGLHGGMQGAV